MCRDTDCAHFITYSLTTVLIFSTAVYYTIKLACRKRNFKNRLHCAKT